MILRDLGPRTGKLVTIAADPGGWVAPWQDEADGHLRLSQLRADGEPRTADVALPAGGGNAYPCVWVDPVTWHTWIAWRHEQIGGIVVNVTTGAQKFLGWVHGNSPIALGGGRVWYQADAVYTIAARALLALDEWLPVSGWLGKPTGLAGVDPVDGLPIFVDDVRFSVPGMLNPQPAGRCTVGENTDAGPDRNIARLDDGRRCELWPGLTSNTPHLATDGHAFGVVTWGGPGVRLALLTDPPDFRPVVVPPPHPPPLPPSPPPPEKPKMKTREQFADEFRQLDAFYAADDGLKRPGGMLFPADAGNPIARTDVEAMAAWGYNLMAGATVDECKARIRQSQEWKDKHPQ